MRTPIMVCSDNCYLFFVSHAIQRQTFASTMHGIWLGVLNGKRLSELCLKCSLRCSHQCTRSSDLTMQRFTIRAFVYTIDMSKSSYIACLCGAFALLHQAARIGVRQLTPDRAGAPSRSTGFLMLQLPIWSLASSRPYSIRLGLRLVDIRKTRSCCAESLARYIFARLPLQLEYHKIHLLYFSRKSAYHPLPQFNHFKINMSSNPDKEVVLVTGTSPPDVYQARHTDSLCRGNQRYRSRHRHLYRICISKVPCHNRRAQHVERRNSLERCASQGRHPRHTLPSATRCQ